MISDILSEAIDRIAEYRDAGGYEDAEYIIVPTVLTMTYLMRYFDSPPSPEGLKNRDQIRTVLFRVAKALQGLPT